MLHCNEQTFVIVAFYQIAWFLRRILFYAFFVLSLRKGVLMSNKKHFFRKHTNIIFSTLGLNMKTKKKQQGHEVKCNKGQNQPQK